MRLESSQLWKQFDTTCTRAKHWETLSTAHLNECTVTLAASVIYKNWQRPGALCNTTVAEFRQCKLVHGKTPVYVLAVREHKTVQGYYITE